MKAFVIQNLRWFISVLSYNPTQTNVIKPNQSSGIKCFCTLSVTRKQKGFIYNFKLVFKRKGNIKSTNFYYSISTLFSFQLYRGLGPCTRHPGYDRSSNMLFHRQNSPRINGAKGTIIPIKTIFELSLFLHRCMKLLPWGIPFYRWSTTKFNKLSRQPSYCPYSNEVQMHCFST